MFGMGKDKLEEENRKLTTRNINLKAEKSNLQDKHRKYQKRINQLQDRSIDDLDYYKILNIIEHVKQEGKSAIANIWTVDSSKEVAVNLAQQMMNNGFMNFKPTNRDLQCINERLKNENCSYIPSNTNRICQKNIQ